ncbi:hypothetical protein D3C80_1664730 [compost metagenome]
MDTLQLFLLGIADPEQHAPVIKKRKRRVKHIFYPDIALPVSAPALIVHSETECGVFPSEGAVNLIIKGSREMGV